MSAVASLEKKARIRPEIGTGISGFGKNKVEAARQLSRLRSATGNDLKWVEIGTAALTARDEQKYVLVPA